MVVNTQDREEKTMSILKKTENITTAYEGGNGHIIEVIKTGNNIEFWIFKKDYGIKSFMFGINETDLAKERTTLEDFIATFFLYNVEEYINDYDEQYVDEI